MPIGHDTAASKSRKVGSRLAAVETW